MPPIIPHPEIVPSIDSEQLERHNRITGWHYADDKETSEQLLNRNIITLSPHPPVQLDDPIDWYATESQQRNWCAQLHMLRWLEHLLRRIDERDEAARKRCKEIVSSWAQSAFSDNPPLWAWENMIDAIRVFQLMKVYMRVSPEYQPFLQSVLYAHGMYLENPENLGAGNHALHQHEALFALGDVFGEEKWVNLALTRLTDTLHDSFTDMGSTAESTPEYRVHNFKLWKQVQKRIPNDCPLQAEITDTLKQSAALIAHEVRPDGYLETLGDTSHHASTTALADFPEIEYILSHGKKGSAPEETTKILDSDYIYGRSGWGENARDFTDEFFYSLGFGKRSIHKHNDLGSVTMYSHGTTVLIDGGKYGYMSGKWRQYFLNREAHNTLYIENVKPEKSTSYTLDQQHSDSFCDDFTVVGKPYKNVKHERRLIYVKGADALIVIDTIHSPVQHDYTLAWHFNEQAKLEQSGHTTHITIDDEHFRHVQLGDTSCDTRLLLEGQEIPYIQGYYSPAYSSAAPCPTLLQTYANTNKMRVVNIVGHAANNIFDATTTSNTQAIYKLHTKHGYFTVDTSTHPARIIFSREQQTPTRTTTPTTIKGIAPHVINKLTTLSPKYPKTADKLLKRLAHITGTQGTMTDIFNSAFTSPNLFETRDYGLRGTLVDLIAAYDESIATQLHTISSLFRKPFFTHDNFRETNTDTTPYDLIYQPRNEPFHALSIRDQHTLYWQGERGQSTLFVRFNGSIDRSRTQLPYCGGSNMHMLRPESWLIFADPTLDRDAQARLTWYLGKTSTSTIYDEINTIVDSYVKEWSITKVIYTGSSGGGYAALQTGLRRGNSTILAINPQTILSNYSQKFYLSALDIADLDEDEDAELLDASLLLNSSQAHTTDIYYISNPHDNHHSKHCIPFKQAAENNKISLTIVEYPLGEGHVSLTSFELMELMNSVV